MPPKSTNCSKITLKNFQFCALPSGNAYSQSQPDKPTLTGYMICFLTHHIPGASGWALNSVTHNIIIQLKALLVTTALSYSVALNPIPDISSKKKTKNHYHFLSLSTT